MFSLTDQHIRKLPQHELPARTERAAPEEHADD